MNKVENIRELRARTNVSLGECKKALEEANDNIDLAIEILQKRGALRAAAKSGRIAADGRVVTYTHNGGKLSVIAEINCETDFAAKSDLFKEFCEQVVLQIAASNPSCVNVSDVPAGMLYKQQDIFLAQIPNLEQMVYGKVMQILNGKTSKWFAETCLMNQELL